MRGGWPLPLRLYGLATGVLLRPAYGRAARRLAEGGVREARRRERLGFATLGRPEGRLVWFHAASVGESLSVLPLVERVVGEAQVLVTTGTAASAEVLAKRLPPGARHQFAPLDARGPVGRFLSHWRPDLAVFVESEIWPVTLREAEARGVPLVLMNARLSERSLRSWGRAPQTARALLGLFARIVTQTEGTRDRLVALGVEPRRVSVGGNMKAAAPPPPDDPEERARIEAEVGDAPVWAAVSTHPGEEEVVLAAHRLVQERHPGARLVLVPRHPVRAGEVAALVRRAGFGVTRRSEGGRLTEAVYLADTMGETGLWFRLCPVVFLGGSLVPVGGHNPWEVVQCGAALLVGPLRETVRADVAALEAEGAAVTVSAEEIGERVAELLADPARLKTMREAGRRLAGAQVGRTEALAEELLGMLR